MLTTEGGGPVHDQGRHWAIARTMEGHKMHNMRDTYSETNGAMPPPAKPKETAATQEWDNEGGATAPARPAVVVNRIVFQSAAPSGGEAVEAKQDQIMTVISSDGASPSRRWQLTGWHWLAIGVPVLMLVGGFVWAVSAAGVGMALAGLVVVVVMFGAAVPVWGAGLFRGGEEREAKVEAQAEVREER